MPNILAATITLALGWFFAGILRRVVTSILSASGADRLAPRIGLKTEEGKPGPISQVAGWTVFLVVLIPVLLAALDALQMQSLTQPTSQMLGQILSSIPIVFAAGLVLAIAYGVGKLVTNVIVRVLESARFDNVPHKLGLDRWWPQNRRPSRVVGFIVMASIMIFAALTSLDLLGFASLSAVLTSFVYLVGHVLLGLVIFGLGIYVANYASGVIIGRQTPHCHTWAMVARVSILVLTGAMALRQMGVANEIITLAFGLTLGAAAVAAAIAFGFGGRDMAARKLNEWEESRTHTRSY
jgi:hypothetical protein